MPRALPLSKYYDCDTLCTPSSLFVYECVECLFLTENFSVLTKQQSTWKEERVEFPTNAKGKIENSWQFSSATSSYCLSNKAGQLLNTQRKRRKTRRGNCYSKSSLPKHYFASVLRCQHNSLVEQNEHFYPIVIFCCWQRLELSAINGENVYFVCTIDSLLAWWHLKLVWKCNTELHFLIHMTHWWWDLYQRDTLEEHWPP